MYGIIEKIFFKIRLLPAEGVQRSPAYFLFRVVIALNFMQHGAQKLLGLLGGTGDMAIPEFGLIWFAGLIELVGGALIALGLFTRVAALFATASMAYAYLIVHFPQGFFPVLNKGELALLYFAAFLLILIGGAGRWSLERLFWKREIF